MVLFNCKQSMRSVKIADLIQWCGQHWYNERSVFIILHRAIPITNITAVKIVKLVDEKMMALKHLIDELYTISLKPEYSAELAKT